MSDTVELFPCYWFCWQLPGLRRNYGETCVMDFGHMRSPDESTFLRKMTSWPA